MSYTDIVGLQNPCDSLRSAPYVRYSYSTNGSRVVVCDVRFSVLVSVTSNKVLVVVVLFQQLLVHGCLCWPILVHGYSYSRVDNYRYGSPWSNVGCS